MTTLTKTPESTMKVRFHDCDPFNHLNNSRYLDYIMSARTDQLLDYYGFDIYRIAREQRVGWVTAQTQISYLAPALLAEELVIQTQLISFSNKSLVFEAMMWDSGKRSLKAFLQATLVHFNLKTQQSEQHSGDLMEFFQQVVNPPVGGTSFEERVKTIRSSEVKHIGT